MYTWLSTYLNFLLVFLLLTVQNDNNKIGLVYPYGVVSFSRNYHFWVPGYCASRKENQSSDQFSTSKVAKAALFLSHEDTQDT